MTPDDFHLPLVLAAIAFFAYMLFRLRPTWGEGDGDDGGERLPIPDAVRARMEGAATGAEKGEALAAAADFLAGRVGRRGSAARFYLRAMRADPTSVALVDRATLGLRRQPRLLESLLWRRLGDGGWDGAGKPPAERAFLQLARLYAGPLRSAPRARAMEAIAAALTGRPVPAAPLATVGGTELGTEP